MFSQRPKFTHLVFSFTALLCLFAVVSHSAVSITSVDVISPNDNTTPLASIDARGAVDDFSIAPGTGLVRVEFSDGGCASTVNDYFISFKAKAQDESEYTLVDFKQNGEGGTYSAMYLLNIYSLGGCNYRADYEWNPTDSQALGFYDIYAYVVDDINGTTDSSDYAANTDTVELVPDHLPGFFAEAPVIESISISDPNLDNDGTPAGGDSTDIRVDFYDDDAHFDNELTATVKLLHPDGVTERTILSGSNGSFVKYGTDGGAPTIAFEKIDGSFHYTYALLFTAWNPEDSPSYSVGEYDLEVSIEDPDGLASVSTYSLNQDAITLSADGTTAGTSAPAITLPIAVSVNPVNPGGSTILTVNFDDSNGGGAGDFTATVKVRAQDNSSEFACAAVVATAGPSYTATCTFDSTGKPLGWYDIYVYITDLEGNGIESPYDDSMEAFKVAPTIDVTSTFSTEWLIDRQPDNDPGDFTPISTTFTACFSDTWTGNYYATLKVREPDNSSVINLVSAQPNGSGGVTISQAPQVACASAAGVHLISYDWTPTATDPEGYYDLYVSVYDGATPSDVATSDYNENADIVLVQIDPVGSPPFPFNDSPTVGAASTNPVTGIQVTGTNTIDISASFQDEDLEPVSSYGVSLYLRAPDNSTVYNVMVDQSNGSSVCADGAVSTSCVLNITSNGDGTYDLTLTWDPKDTLPLGWYDVKIIVTDGIGSGGESSFDTNANLVGVDAAAGSSPPTGSVDIVATSASPTSVTQESGTPVTLTVNFSDTLDTPGTYTYVYKVRDGSGSETTITCDATTQTNVGTSYEATCDWLTTGLEALGWYDIYVSVTNDLEGTGDIGDVSGFDENIGKFQLLAAVNKTPNAPTAITQYIFDGVTPLAVGGHTNNPTIVFEADMTDQNALDDLYLEIEYQDTSTAFTTFPTFTCLADAIHIFTTGTPVTGTVTCDSLPDGYYHWQAHSVDYGFLESPWTSYGGNADPGDADFVIDTVVPAVTSTVPANFAEMDVLDSIVINFSAVEALDCSTIVNDGSGGSPDSVTITKISDSSFVDLSIDSCTDGDNFITLTPLAPLVRLSQYEVTITTDVADLATNNMAANYVFTVLASTPNQPPLVPANLTQYKIGGVIPITVGGYTNETEVVFKGDMTDGNTVDDGLTFELEYLATGAAFVDSKTVTCVPDGIHFYSGSAITGEVSCDTLPDGSYHWQAKVVDFDFAESAWTSYGGNLDPGDADFTVDTVAPAVTSTVPVDFGEMDVADSIVINFSAVEALNCSTILNDGAGGSVDSVTIIKGSDSSFVDLTIDACTDGDNLITLTPISSLVRLSTYTVTITTDVADMATNNMVGNYVFTVIASTPNQPPLVPAPLTQYKADGVTPIAVGGYTNETTVKFKGDMTDGNTVDDGLTLEVEYLLTGAGFVDVKTGSCVPDTIHPYSGSAVTGEVSCGSLAEGNYHWQAKAVDFDLASSAWTSYGGNLDPGDVDFIVDLTAPTVTTTDPVNAANGSRAQDVTINFNVANGPIDCTTVDTTNITLTGDGAELPAIVSCSDTQVVINPKTDGDGNLTDGQVYTVTVTTNVKDKAGNPFAAPYVFTYTAKIYDTIVGALSAVKGTPLVDSHNSIDVSMGYTGDANTNNTYTVMYKLSSEPVTWTPHVVGAANTATPYLTTIPALTEGESYDVAMTFNDADGVGIVNPNTISGIVLDVYSTYPSIATAAAVSNSQIEITMPWTFDDNINNTYTIDYTVDGGAAYVNNLVTAAAHVASPYVNTIGGLTEGGTYAVRVTYNDANGFGGVNPNVQEILNITIPFYSTTAGVGTAAQKDNTSIDVAMDYTNDGNNNNTYKVRYRESPAGGWTTINGVHVLSPYGVNIPGLTNGLSYDIEMSYLDADGVTGSAVQTLTVLLRDYITDGTGSTAVANGDTQIDVSMPYTGDDNTGPTVNVDNSYKVRYRVNPAGPWTDEAIAAKVVSPYTMSILGLIPGTTYDIEMVFLDSDGVTGDSPKTVTIAMAVNALRPQTATAVTGSGTGEIDFSMPYLDDSNGTGTVTVEYRVCCAGGYTPWVTDVAIGVSPYSGTINFLGDGVTYEISMLYSDSTDSVDLTDAPGNANPQLVTATTKSNKTTTGVVTAVASGGTDIDVSIPWTNDDNNDNEYRIEYEKVSAPGYIVWGADPHSHSGVNPYLVTITGLEAGQTYNVRVTYIDTDGVTGTNPQVVSNIILSDVKPTRVADLTVNTTYVRGLGLVWTAPTDELGAAASYDIRYIDAAYAPEEFAATSTDPIPGAIWSAMTEVPAEPLPKDITTVPPPPSLLQYGSISCMGSSDNVSCVTTGEGKKSLWPNTLYYVGISSIDSGGKVSDVSNNTETLGSVAGQIAPSEPSHTGLKYGWNAVSIPYAYDATTFAALFQDEFDNNSGLVDVFQLIGGTWTAVGEGSGIDTLTPGEGFYIYGYTSNALDDAGGVLSRNTTTWTNVSLTNTGAGEFNLVGNPYLKNASFNSVKFCSVAVDTGNGNCGGTEYTFVQAVANNWILPTIYYESTLSTAPKMVCNSVCCDGVGSSCPDNDDPPAELRPWWGNWIQNGSSPPGATFYMGVEQPSGL